MATIHKWGNQFKLDLQPISLDDQPIRTGKSAAIKLLKHLPAVVLNESDFKELEEAHIILFSQEAILNLARVLLPFLMEKHLIGTWF